MEGHLLTLGASLGFGDPLLDPLREPPVRGVPAREPPFGVPATGDTFRLGVLEPRPLRRIAPRQGCEISTGKAQIVGDARVPSSRGGMSFSRALVGIQRSDNTTRWPRDDGKGISS